MPQPELDSLARLAQLLDLHDKIAPKTPPPRGWTFAIILLMTLCVLSALLFVHARRTAIELEADATRVAFTLPSEQILFKGIELTRLEASGLTRVTLPPAVTSQWGGAAPGEPAPPIVLTAAESGGRRGSIGIAQIRPKAQSQVDLRLLDASAQYRLSLRDAGTTIEVGVIGPVRVEVTGLGDTLVDFAAPKGIVLEPAKTINLDLTFRDPSGGATTPQVPIANPSFWQVDEFGDRELSVLRTLSTVLGGTLYFESLAGTSRQLRTGEILRFREAAGEVRTLRLRPDRLSLSFHGVVSGMTSGDGNERRSLMPTWLDLLRAQHGLGLLWGSTLYIAGVAMGVYRWWKGSL